MFLLPPQKVVYMKCTTPVYNEQQTFRREMRVTRNAKISQRGELFGEFN